MQGHNFSLIRQIPTIGISFTTRQAFAHKEPIPWVVAIRRHYVNLDAFPKELNNAMLSCKYHRECTRQIVIKKTVLPPKHNVNKFDSSPVF